MNKIKQNKITFLLAISVIAIIFSSLTILSLPVLFNYKSKVINIEKNFYKKFKIYLKSSGKITYKPFPKPHLLVENASLNLSENSKTDDFINTSNLKIYITLRDIYYRSFDNLVSTEITDTNLNITIHDLIKIRKHLYQNINNPIILKNCKVFLRNKKNDVILISPIRKITYNINNKNKIKKFSISAEIFGLNFKSEWKKNYLNPKTILHYIDIFNPNIEIKNTLKTSENEKYNLQTQIHYGQEKFHYSMDYQNDKIKISSPNNKKTNFNIESKIQLKPFYFEGELLIKDKKVEKIIDTILLNLFLYDKNLLGNINGLFKIKFNNLNNKLIKSGEIDYFINEKEINIKKATFTLDKIGKLNTTIGFSENSGNVKFISKNQLSIENHIEFAKVFQIGSKKIKKIKNIYFELEKNIGDTDFIINNVKIGNLENNNELNEIFLVKNIQNLRSHIRKIID